MRWSSHRRTQQKVTSGKRSLCRKAVFSRHVDSYVAPEDKWLASVFALEHPVSQRGVEILRVPRKPADQLTRKLSADRDITLRDKFVDLCRGA